jgi:hypothetical protein
LTLTLDSYGSVDSDGAAVDPARYDYRRAVRDAIHFPALFDRFWQTPGGVSAGTCSTSAPSSHKNGALRISTPPFVAIPRAELRQIIAATYHQVWWHPCQGTLGGTEEAGRHIGYHKYLSKSIGQAAGLDEHAPDAQRDHAHRLHAELQITPCSPRVSDVVAVWYPAPRALATP